MPPVTDPNPYCVLVTRTEIFFHISTFNIFGGAIKFLQNEAPAVGARRGAERSEAALTLYIHAEGSALSAVGALPRKHDRHNRA